MHACHVTSVVSVSVTLRTVAHQSPLSVGFSRQEYCSGLTYPPPGDLPDQGLNPWLLRLPVLAGGFFTTSGTWEAPTSHYTAQMSPPPTKEPSLIFLSKISQCTLPLHYPIPLSCFLYNTLSTIIPWICFKKCVYWPFTYYKVSLMRAETWPALSFLTISPVCGTMPGPQWTIRKCLWWMRASQSSILKGA